MAALLVPPAWRQRRLIGRPDPPTSAPAMSQPSFYTSKEKKRKEKKYMFILGIVYRASTAINSRLEVLRKYLGNSSVHEVIPNDSSVSPV